MKKLKETALKLWKDESGQGATEYIILLVVVVTIGFMFKEQIKQMVDGRLKNVSGALSGFDVETQ